MSGQVSVKTWFLRLDAKDAVSESDLEQALIDHLQEFMLELGHGFCFEARQNALLLMINTIS